MLRGIYGDPERFVQQYWSQWPDGAYFTGDGARLDEDGFYWLLGRVDDVLNVAGHRLGTMEVESALVDHPKVAEAAVVGKPHEIKGQAVAAFVTLKEGVKPSPALADELKEHVVQKIGAIARPDQILFAADLPKTRSGKIMRRLLRDIAEGKALGDTTTLADPAVVARSQGRVRRKRRLSTSLRSRMPHLTAIEFSNDSCVLVRVSVSGTSVEVGGVHVVDPAAFPGGGTFAAALRQAQAAPASSLASARVVLWGMPDGAKSTRPGGRPQLEPLDQRRLQDRSRGVTPCNALAALARVRRPKTDNPVVWLAIDRGGVALIAMRTGELLYSHAFDWDSSVGATGSQAHLLHRYALVSFLAPQIRRAMAVVQEKGRQRRGDRHLRHADRSAIADDAADRGAGHRGRDARLDSTV